MDKAQRLAKALKQLEQRKRERRLYNYRPYGHPDTLNNGELWEKEGWEPWSGKPWQLDFHNMGATASERAQFCANGVGKTISGAAETAFHLTGDYPDWWEGRRFDHPVKAWVGSITNETQREFVQTALLGDDLGENLGTGYIPKEKIVGKVKTKQAGVSDVADICRVRHKSGGVSNCTFKVYEQGWRKWQGSAPHLIWLDEEPEDMRIYDECQTRVLRTNGIIYATLTPLLGQTDLVRHFMSSKQDQIWWIGATWDDAPHLKEERKTQLRNSYPDHVVQARTLGVPMMGEGRIFVIPEEDIRVEPREIPRHWARIKGVDFGINHPSAIGDLAYDRDNDVIYLIRDWREKGLDASEHADAINKHDPWVPVAWPHDGTNKEKGSGKRLKEFYTSKGVKMLSRSACYKSDRLGSQPVEPIIQEINERCADGRFKVFSNCHAFFDEYRNYHRKDGRPIKIRDDVLKAVFYGVMMKRYATTQQVIQLHQNVPRAFSTSL